MPKKDVAASFQAAVVDTLVEKTMLAARENGVDTVVVAGGVAANSGLRKEMTRACQEKNIRLCLPGMQLCIDNAAMIALAGYLHHQRGERSGLDLNPKASLAL
jgi:N6-L-threonylcarbamoyladenine synthase